VARQENTSHERWRRQVTEPQWWNVDGSVVPACLPSKDVIWSAKVASLSGRGPEFGLPSASTVDMAAVRRRKRKMVEDMVNVHLDRYKRPENINGPDR
jgi:hypothetical protein